MLRRVMQVLTETDSIAARACQRLWQLPHPMLRAGPRGLSRRWERLSVTRAEGIPAFTRAEGVMVASECQRDTLMRRRNREATYID